MFAPDSLSCGILILLAIDFMALINNLFFMFTIPLIDFITVLSTNGDGSLFGNKSERAHSLYREKQKTTKK